MFTSRKITIHYVGVFCALAIAHIVSQSCDAQSVPPHTDPMWFPSAGAVIESSTNGQRPFATTFDISGGNTIAGGQLASGWPLGFTVDPTGQYVESVEAGNSINYFQPVYLQENGTVFVNTEVNPGCVSNIYAAGNTLYSLDIKAGAIDVGSPVGNSLGEFGTSQGPTTGTTPIQVTGSAAFSRYFVVNQNIAYGVACNNIPHSVTATGTASVFDPSTGSVSGSLSLGHCPVFGTTSTDGERSFILNRGDDSVTVLDLPRAVVDSTISLSTAGHAGPVHAEYVPKLGELIVANYENDTVSVIDAQLNSNGTDGPTFGTVLATIDLWNGAQHAGTNKYPAFVTALPDGSRAYVANQGDGTISVIDLRLNEAVSTLAAAPGTHPRSLATFALSNTNSIFAQVFVAAPDSVLVPQLYAIDNYVSLPNCAYNEGACAYNGTNVIDVRVTSPNASTGGNNVLWTRTPGGGAPCADPNFAPANLAACQAH